MSDPVLFNVNFLLKKTAPSEIIDAIRYCFDRNYDDVEINLNNEQYSEIQNVWRDDCYHNLYMQKLPFEQDDEYYSVCIISLPRNHDYCFEFLKFIEKYIDSKIPFIGTSHVDYESDLYIYYLQDGEVKYKIVDYLKEEI